MSTQVVEAVPDFAEFILNIRDGELNQRLTDELAALVRAVEETNKAGEMRLKFVVKKEGRMVAIHVKKESKVPEHPISATLFHSGPNGELYRDDPNQMDLRGLEPVKLRTVRDDEDYDN